MMNNWSTTQKYSQRFLFFIELICLTTPRNENQFLIRTFTLKKLLFGSTRFSWDRSTSSFHITRHNHYIRGLISRIMTMPGECRMAYNREKTMVLLINGNYKREDCHLQQSNICSESGSTLFKRINNILYLISHEQSVRNENRHF